MLVLELDNTTMMVEAAAANLRNCCQPAEALQCLDGWRLSPVEIPVESAMHWLFLVLAVVRQHPPAPIRNIATASELTASTFVEFV